MAETMDKKLEKLEVILMQMLEEHNQLDTLLKHKREALRKAEHDQVASYSTLENHRVQAIAELEKQRILLVGELTLMLNPDALEPMSLLQLAQTLPEPVRGRLLVRREILRKKMQEVREIAAAAQRAAQALAQHMHGLIQTLGTAMSGPGAYASSGQAPRSTITASTFSMTA